MELKYINTLSDIGGDQLASFLNEIAHVLGVCMFCGVKRASAGEVCRNESCPSPRGEPVVPSVESAVGKLEIMLLHLDTSSKAEIAHGLRIVRSFLVGGLPTDA